MLPDALDMIRRAATKEPPKDVLVFGLFWDKALNPKCPVCRTPMYIGETIEQTEDVTSHDVLGCPKCSHKYPIRDAGMGFLTLLGAKNYIQTEVAFKRIKF